MSERAIRLRRLQHPKRAARHQAHHHRGRPKQCRPSRWAGWTL